MILGKEKKHGGSLGWERYSHLHELSVDLEVRQGVTPIGSHFLAFVNASEQVLHGTRNDSRFVWRDVDIKPRAHRVSLTRTRLPMERYARIYNVM